jgi:hypothetical protein
LAQSSIRERLAKLENNRLFIDWFLRQRIWEILTLEELDTYVSGGGLPDSLSNRQSSFDRLDRKSLIKLWEADQQIFGGRSREELDFYGENSFWPEQGGRLHYFMEEGQLNVEWRNSPEEGEKTLETKLEPGKLTPDSIRRSK